MIPGITRNIESIIQNTALFGIGSDLRVFHIFGLNVNRIHFQVQRDIVLRTHRQSLFDAMLIIVIVVAIGQRFIQCCAALNGNINVIDRMILIGRFRNCRYFRQIYFRCRSLRYSSYYFCCVLIHSDIVIGVSALNLMVCICQ